MMKEYIFYRKEGFIALFLRDDDDARENAEHNKGTVKVEDTAGNVIWAEPIKPFYKHYFAKVNGWDDKIANSFLELGYGVSICVPLDKVKICLLSYQYIENEQGRFLAKSVMFVDINWYVQYKARRLEDQFSNGALSIDDLQITAWELNERYDNLLNS